MKENTRKYLNEEIDICNKIWEEHYFNKNNTLEHFHICDFQLKAMLSRYRSSYRKYIKDWDSMCEEYLKSIGHKRDTNMECCDYCPHMRYLTLTEDDYFINIASLGIDKWLFEEEKSNGTVNNDR